MNLPPRLAEGNALVNSNLGAAYHAVGRDEDAASAFQRSLEVNPTARGFSNLGTLLYYMGRYSDASLALERAVALDANAYARWGNLGDAYRWTPGSAPKANEAYRHAIQLARELLGKSPETPDVRSSLAGYLAKSDDLAGALKVAGAIAGPSLQKPGILFKLAIVHELSHDRKKALEFLQKAVAAGYSRKEVQNEPEFLALRRDPAYLKISQEVPTVPLK